MSKILRAACYVRVSSDEQALHGYSISAQKESLVEYCGDHNIKIVDFYNDEGISGSKPPLKRPDLQRLLNDVKDGKIDIILFTKLDRWFRSVKEYFKVQEVLDNYGVEWKTIHEDYDTTTSNGRMAITIFLALAQNEQEKASERVIAVFNHKRKNKEVYFSDRIAPFGYKVEPDEAGVRRLVKNPEFQDAVQEFWDIATKYDNISKAGRYVNTNYGINRSLKLWYDVAHNEIYTGKNGDVEDFCPAYVSKEDFNRLQSRRIKRPPSNRVYLFTGLIRCPVCGNSLNSNYTSRKNKDGSTIEYHLYRCIKHQADICSNPFSISESKIEKWLLDNITRLMQEKIASVKINKSKPKPKPKNNINKLKEQLRRLEVVYLAGNKTDAEYLAESAEIQEAIKKCQEELEDTQKEDDIAPLVQMLETDFISIYNTLNQEDKRRFWRNLIKEIHIEDSKIISVDFL